MQTSMQTTIVVLLFFLRFTLSSNNDHKDKENVQQEDSITLDDDRVEGTIDADARNALACIHSVI